MEQISLVTARIVRQNAQYAYELKGKGEQYLVRHEEGENAGEKVVEYLTPYAAQPVVVEAVALQKGVEFINADNQKDGIYRCVVEYVETDMDTNKEKKVRRVLYVYANSIRQTLHAVDEDFGMEMMSVASVSRTKIIELL